MPPQVFHIATGIEGTQAPGHDARICVAEPAMAITAHGNGRLLELRGTYDDASLWIFDRTQRVFFRQSVELGPLDRAYRKVGDTWQSYTVNPSLAWEPASRDTRSLLEEMNAAVVSHEKELRGEN